MAPLMREDAQFRLALGMAAADQANGWTKEERSAAIQLIHNEGDIPASWRWKAQAYLDERRKRKHGC